MDKDITVVVISGQAPTWFEGRPRGAVTRDAILTANGHTIHIWQIGDPCVPEEALRGLYAQISTLVGAEMPEEDS